MDQLELRLIGPPTHHIYSTAQGETFSPVITGCVSFPGTQFDIEASPFQIHVCLVRITAAKKQHNEAKKSASAKFLPKRLLSMTSKDAAVVEKPLLSMDEVVHCEFDSSACLATSHPTLGQVVTANFSIIVPSHLPGTTTTAVGGISYSLVASVTKPNGQTLHSSQDMRLLRTMVPDASTPTHYVREFPQCKLRTELLLSPQTPSHSDSPLAYATKLLIQGAAPLPARASEETYLVVRQLKWSVEETIKVSTLPNNSASEESYQHTQTRKVCSGIQKKECKMASPSGTFGRATIEVPINIAFDKDSQLACDVDPSSFTTDAKQLPDSLTFTQRPAITVSHQLRLELLTGQDTISKGDGKLVARQNAKNLIGAVFPLPVQHVAHEDSIPEGILEPTTCLPVYEGAGSPPAYAVVEA